MHTLRRTLTWEATVLLALALLTPRGGEAQTPAFATIYSFKGGSDGRAPNGVILGENGALYGTTFVGGTNICGLNIAYGCGTVFELAPAEGSAWTKTVLYSFDGADGASPSPSLASTPGSKLAFGSNGALYGTTEAGGSNDSSGTGPGGTVFELAPPASAGGVWTESVLHSFPNSVSAPHTLFGGVSIGPGGTLYGTTSYNHWTGGSFGVETGGTVFGLKPPSSAGGSWTGRNLFDFWSDGALGMLPAAGLVWLGGSLYGTTYFTNSLGGCGAVYELTPPVAAGGAWAGR
jgi:uncharacterized repeat protein (TIGR03803 family)